MGCEGNIEVYDWKKVKDKFPDAGEKLTSSLGYIQTMKTPDGKVFEVFSGYWGDNMYSTWSEIGETIAYGESDEYKSRCKEIVLWMNENAKLFTWEVWT